MGSTNLQELIGETQGAESSMPYERLERSGLGSTPASAAVSRARANGVHVVILGRADRFHVPLGDPALVRYFLDCLFAAHGRRERVVGSLARRLPASLAAALVLKRRWSLALDCLGAPVEAAHGENRVPDPVGDARGSGVGHSGVEHPPWVGALSRVLRRLARDWPAGDLPAELHKLSWILLEDYADSRRHSVLVFLFGANRPGPSAVMKLRYTGPKTDGLLREKSALDTVGPRLERELQATVPRALAHEETGTGEESLLLTSVPGRSAYAELRNSFRPESLPARHFRTAAVWLARFHLASRSPRAFEPAGERRSVREILSAAEGSDDLRWLDELDEICAGRPLSMSFSHGDFWARNLLVPPRADALPSVVDWECFEEEAPPFVDLFHFPISYGWIYPWPGQKSTEEIFRLTFLEKTPVSRAVRRYLRTYCDETGLDRRALKPLLHLYLLTRFSRLALRHLGRPGGAGKPHALALSLHRALAASDGALCAQ
jgi:aminoglycoside phosphotransferase (APT) family kinase protein